ncbi:MAG: hypothetical protein Q8P56_03115 [Candidatus Uhrbacteria bacterium]|nr:hypothetical protein [Candidatus Uhrbacteria bacterium]
MRGGQNRCVRAKQTGGNTMDAMDVAVARRFKNIVLSPLSPMERDIGACEVLLDVLESGDFANPEMVANMLQQAANAIDARRHLKVFGGRLAQLIERAESPHQLKLEGPWEAVGQ